MPMIGDPDYKTPWIVKQRCLWSWRVRMLSYWMMEHKIPGHQLIYKIGIRF